MSEPLHLAERAAARLRAGGGIGALLGGSPAHAPGSALGSALGNAAGNAPGTAPADAPAGAPPGAALPPSSLAPPEPAFLPPAASAATPADAPAAAPDALPEAASPDAAAADGRAPRGRRALTTAALLRGGMIEWGRKRSRISEEFRIVQGQLLRTQLGLAENGVPGANLVLVTSARPEEGKSFTALNLACAVARYGEMPVLLLDADAKHNSLSMLLGLTEEPGLLDLAGNPRLEPASMVLRTEVPFFSVLPIGGAGAQKEQLSASLPLANTVMRIGREMPRHVVVLDAPPCMVSSDPSTLAAVVGQVVMLVEAQRTQRGELDAALEMVAACDTVSLVLNKVRSRAGDTFGADGYYGAYYKS